MNFELADYLLPGVALDRITEALGKAAGQELTSGKFGSPQSSSALAVNGFGAFLENPGLLPPFPGLSTIDWPAVRVDVEREMRFPWSGGRHPWLDAAVETEKCLIGVESKRYEPFRDRKRAKLSPKYASIDWGSGMQSWCQMRDRLVDNPLAYRHLDAAQLVKHSYGLVTEARRQSKQAALLYLFAEPSHGPKVDEEAKVRHRAEIAEFGLAVAGADVAFHSCSWREWLKTFPQGQKAHADRLIARFHP